MLFGKDFKGVKMSRALLAGVSTSTVIVRKSDPFHGLVRNSDQVPSNQLDMKSLHLFFGKPCQSASLLS